MSSIYEQAKEHPKIISSVILVVVLSAILFSIGYGKAKKAKKSNPGAEGMKWVGIALAVLVLLSVLSMVIFKMDFLALLLIGGQVVSAFFNLIGSLLSEL